MIQTYQGELDYLRKRLQTCETDKVVLAKNIKLVKNQELEVKTSNKVECAGEGAQEYGLVEGQAPEGQLDYHLL